MRYKAKRIYPPLSASCFPLDWIVVADKSPPEVFYV
jgi:hypothetical protein